MLNDKIIHIAVSESKVYGLSESGKLYSRYSNSEEWDFVCESPKKQGTTNSVPSKKTVTKRKRSILGIVKLS